MEKSSAALHAADRCWKLDFAFMAGMAGDAGGDCLHKAVLALMPGPNCTKDITTVIQQTSDLKNSGIYKFSSRAAQASVDAAMELLSSFLQGRRPKLPTNASSFLTAFRARLQYFITYDMTSKDKTKVTLVGERAVKALLDILRAKPEAEVTLEDLQPLQCAFFLLKPTALEFLDFLTEKALFQAGFTHGSQQGQDCCCQV